MSFFIAVSSQYDDGNELGTQMNADGVRRT